MKLNRRYICLVVSILCLCNCNSNNGQKGENKIDSTYETSLEENNSSTTKNDNTEQLSNSNDNNKVDISTIYVNTYEKDVDDEETNQIEESGCKFKDDTYSATVEYHNSETGYSATYTLDVVVEDCQIIEIDFPNDGYLDSDHISFADIDEDGNAIVEGEDGKTYEITINE